MTRKRKRAAVGEARQSAYDRRAAAYAAGVTAECDACHSPCPEHGVTGCRLCHTHPGECGYGGCTAPEQLLALDFWSGTPTIAQRRTLCVQHMRYWRHECLDDIDRTIQSPDAAIGHPVVTVVLVGIAAGGETLVGARLALRRLREEVEYAGLFVEVLTASLRAADLDASTLADVAAIGEVTRQMNTAAARASAGLDARHSRLENAVNATPHPARTSFYRRQQAGR